jgi:dipeptidyl aminopeptidase/acylaminoacyl peptidase
MGEVSLSECLHSLPPAEHEAAVPADVAKLFPQLHINTSFPPTMFIHGEKDTSVSLSESKYTHKQLQKVGARSELHIVPGAEYGLVILPERKLVLQAEGLYKEAFEFG